jgi:hypothetical protein
MKKILLACLAVLVIADCNKKEPSLAAWWDFNSIENGFVKDLSGNHLDALSYNVTLTEGKSGKAFDSNGKAYFEVKYDPLFDNFKEGLTIAAWVNRDTSTQWNCIITRETNDNWSEYFDLAVFQNIPLFSVDTDGKSFIKTDYKCELPVHQWVHLAGTFDNKTYKLYIEGKEVYSGTMEKKFSFSDKNPWIIGANTNDNGKTIHDHFFGKIDELKVFNRALSSGEINDLSK